MTSCHFENILHPYLTKINLTYVRFLKSKVAKKEKSVDRLSTYAKVVSETRTLNRDKKTCLDVQLDNSGNLEKKA